MSKRESVDAAAADDGDGVHLLFIHTDPLERLSKLFLFTILLSIMYTHPLIMLLFIIERTIISSPKYYSTFDGGLY